MFVGNPVLKQLGTYEVVLHTQNARKGRASIALAAKHTIPDYQGYSQRKSAYNNVTVIQVL